MNTDYFFAVVHYFQNHYCLLFFLFYILIIFWKIYKVAFELSDEEKLFDINHLDDEKERQQQILTDINTRLNADQIHFAKELATKYKFKFGEETSGETPAKKKQKLIKKSVTFKAETQKFFY